MRAFLISLFSLVSLALAGVQEQWWNITFVQDVNPDGLFPRQVIGVNNTWPPPPLDVNTTDSLILHVTNSLDKPTSIHHHGMFFNSTSWMDGVLGITECGIPPGGHADYVVPINSSGQWGTFWVHGHAGGQYIDGLRAPLLLHPPQEVFSYDEEFTVILGDWYHQQQPALLQSFINIANPGGAEPVPNSGLIYFAQNASYLGPIPGTSPTGASSAVGFNENATLPFEPGKTYRLRIINTSGFAAFYFWIDGHEMNIIEVDGTDVQPSPIDLINIAVAQRYSILVTARNDTSSNWVMHANMDTTMFDTVPPSLNPNITSSITYSPGAMLTNNGTIDDYHDVNDTSLVPVMAIPQPVATRTIQLAFGFATLDDGTNRAIINDVTFNDPIVPTIFSELSLGSNATIQQAYGTQSAVLDHLEVFDIVIQNTDTGKHPFHLHGHRFMIVGRSLDFTSSDPALNPPIVEGQPNPIRRDTVEIPAGESVTLRLVADNPGTWLLHCHIEWHLEVGLAYQFIEAPIQAQQRNTVPQLMYDNCQTLDQPFSGNAAGHQSPLDLSGLPLGPFIQNLGWHSRGIGAMAGCVLAAVLGMATVLWYSLGGAISDEEIEHQTRAKIAAKEKKRRLFGLMPPKKRD